MRRQRGGGLAYSVEVAEALQGWFEDPTGRFDGRFFDGHVWTDRVSVGGRLRLDAEWVTRDWPETVEPQSSQAENSQAENSKAERSKAEGSQAESASAPAITAHIPMQDRRGSGDRRQVNLRVAVDRRQGQRRRPEIVIPGAAELGALQGDAAAAIDEAAAKSDVVGRVTIQDRSFV